MAMENGPSMDDLPMNKIVIFFHSYVSHHRALGYLIFSEMSSTGIYGPTFQDTVFSLLGDSPNHLILGYNNIYIYM